jgi:putative salt-induced outer membrane protein
LRDKWSLYTTSVYSTNNAPGASPSTTANAIRGGIRYDHDLASVVFYFGKCRFHGGCIARAQPAISICGGLGYHVIRRDNTTLDLLAGPNYTRENYTTLTRNIL